MPVDDLLKYLKTTPNLRDYALSSHFSPDTHVLVRIAGLNPYAGGT